MYRQYLFNALYFNYDFTISDHIHTISTVQFDLLIYERKCFLALNRNTVFIQFITVALVIGRLQ